MDCKNCEAHTNKEPVTVPFYAVEGTNYRTNKTMRWMAVVFIVSLLVIAIVIGLCGLMVYKTNKECLDKIDAINQHWIDYLSEYDFSGESLEITQDGRGVNIYGDQNGVDFNGVIDDGTENQEDSSQTDTEGRQE